jgi:hypothetical protein
VIRGPFRPAAGAFEVRLRAGERRVVRELVGQLRSLLADEDPSTDPAVARLYPPAHPDDPLENLEFERVVGPRLADSRAQAIETIQRTLEAKRLSPEELHAWLRVLNDVRLVLGTRLDVTEGSTEAEFADDPVRHQAYASYVFLSWLVDAIVEVLPAG